MIQIAVHQLPRDVPRRRRILAGTALFWAARSGGPVDVDPDYRVLERGFDGFPLIETDDRSIGKVQFFDDWVTHKDADAYWEDIDDPRRAHTIRAPVLLMGGGTIRSCRRS